MPDPRMLLWCDVESTGLLTDDIPPTILEMAWTVTDDQGTQLTPMRHRYTSLTVELANPRVTPVMITGGDLRWRYAPDDYPADPVREMHATNGLAYGHANAVAAPLDRWATIDELFVADLDTAGWKDFERGELILAGGGQSHYEHRFLPDWCPDVFSDERMHYSAGADVSTVLRTLHTRYGDPFPRTADHVIRWARDVLGANRTDYPEWRWLDVEIDDDFRHRLGPSDSGWLWADRDDHRAYSGVARALTVYRLLGRFLHHDFPELPAPAPTP